MFNQTLLSNPLFQQAAAMAKGKTPDQIQVIAQNLCNERGININDAWRQFQNQKGGY